MIIVQPLKWMGQTERISFLMQGAVLSFEI